MSDTIKIKVEVNGKEVPLSNISMETIGKIRDAESKKIPVVRIATLDNLNDRLIFKVTESIANQKGRFVAISIKKGYVGSHWLPKDDNDSHDGVNFYTDVKSLESLL